MLSWIPQRNLICAYQVRQDGRMRYMIIRGRRFLSIPRRNKMK